MHHWFWGCWWRPVCILTAQTFPKLSQRRTRRGWLLSTVFCQRSSYQNEIPRWDSPSLPLRHSMPKSRECRKMNKMAWPGTTLHTKLLLVNSQCLHPNMCWRTALVFPLTFGSHVLAISLLRSLYGLCRAQHVQKFLLLWDASICECSFSHSTSRPGFQKIEAEHLWKEGTLESPQTVYSDINCDSLKNIIQYFYRRLFF